MEIQAKGRNLLLLNLEGLILQFPLPPTKNYAVFSKGKEMRRWQFRYSIEVCVDTKVAAYVILKKICFCHTQKSCICSELLCHRVYGSLALDVVVSAAQNNTPFQSRIEIIEVRGPFATQATDYFLNDSSISKTVFRARKELDCIGGIPIRDHNKPLFISW